MYFKNVPINFGPLNWKTHLSGYLHPVWWFVKECVLVGVTFWRIVGFFVVCHQIFLWRRLLSRLKQVQDHKNTWATIHDLKQSQEIPWLLRLSSSFLLWDLPRSLRRCLHFRTQNSTFEEAWPFWLPTSCLSISHLEWSAFCPCFSTPRWMPLQIKEGETLFRF